MPFPRASRSRSLMLMSALALSLAWSGTAQAEAGAKLPDYVIAAFGTPPAVPSGPLSPDVRAAVQHTFIDSVTAGTWGAEQVAGLEKIAASGDPRLAWIISDLLRFVSGGGMTDTLADTASRLLQKDMTGPNPWGSVTDHLIAWEIPAPPDYLDAKRAIFTNLVPGWERIFVEGEIDWRMVSWGGVLIDDRPFGQTDAECNCIPAADNPEVTSAAEAAWLKDDDVVFGVEVNGEFRAYPRQIMEVREMVNDTLGGRDLGIPYCTLCGAAQAYFTDRMPAGVKRPVLRTSGLLIRSNKVMYDVETYSVFDTFLGKAVTGPLAKIGLHLEQATVITTDWGTWKREHPETTVLARGLALGRNFNFRDGRDANGPIFPVGDVDPRLSVHEDVIGVLTESGRPVAFQRSSALVALKQGKKISIENVHLELAAGGIKAVGADGSDLGSHQAFRFAWSLFHPDTVVWPG